jgi:Rha family phage regulatory protein
MKATTPAVTRNAPTLTPTPKVTVDHEQVTASSIDVAEYFGREHYRVLRAIDNLEVSQEYRHANFGETVQKRPSPLKPGTTIESRVITMTKKGFTLLVMGFTGKKAMQFKLAYIEAFEAMEKQLEEKNLPPKQLPMECKRFLGLFDKDGRMSMIEISPDAYVFSLDQLPHLLTSHLYPSPSKELLIQISQAAALTALHGATAAREMFFPGQ